MSSLIGIDSKWECSVCCNIVDITTPIVGYNITINSPLKCACGAARKYVLIDIKKSEYTKKGED